MNSSVALVAFFDPDETAYFETAGVASVLSRSASSSLDICLYQYLL